MSDSIFRLFQIIEYLANSNDWVSLRTMSRELHINAASVYRTLNGLKEIGYIRQHPQDSKYQLTLKIARISSQVLENVQLRQIAHPFMEHLTSITNETTHLAVLEGYEFVYIDKVDNKQAVKMRSRVGQRGQLHCTAAGKALLAFSPEADLPQMLSHLKFHAVTEKTIIDPKKFKDQLVQIRRQGYALDDEENEVGIRCIGSPVFDHVGRVTGALSISGWTITMTRERILQLAPELNQTSLKISKELGYTNGKQGRLSGTYDGEKNLKT